MDSRHTGPPPPSRVVTDSGVDHVRLAYHYLDTGDLDGYGSLLDPDVFDGGTGDPDVDVDADAEALAAGLERPGPPGVRHQITRIMAEGDCVVAIGRVAPQQRDFVDVFTLSAEGMLRGRRRYYAPSAP
ncbi:nuclear transport factor 2 family protein [Streptomyces sp. NPDC093225]|uniref:nuclear transport factor 2 family protein n=1 Tax=Streptomyces sp. NPDC093225 TaxID=3366034 RepID=UPI0038165597